VPVCAGLSYRSCADGTSILLDLMERNAELNIPTTSLDGGGVDEATSGPGQSNLHVAELSWGEPISETIPVEKSSLILAADCVYFEVSLVSLLA
jgi:hypothetical protein